MIFLASVFKFTVFANLLIALTRSASFFAFVKALSNLSTALSAFFSDFSAFFAAFSSAFSALSSAFSAASSAFFAAFLSALSCSSAKAIDPNSSIPVILLTTILAEYEKMVANAKIKVF